MKYVYTFLLGVFALSTSIMAQENFRQQDRWLALIDYAQVKPETIKNAAPHFPKTDVSNEKSYKEFVEKLAQWKKRHAPEVEALLAIPEIKKLNPSRVHLGLQQAVELRKFENSYWQWIQAAGLNADEVSVFAPNFPKPRITNDLDKSETVYDAALQDWMKLFPKEHEALLNHPKLIALKKEHQTVVVDAPVTEQFVLIEVKETMPLKADFDSGNAALDNLRFDLALKHWYFKYKPEEYLTKYNVTEYHKNVEQKQ
jgi:hypothetical protein